MWHEYRILANFEKQKETIRSLRRWIQSLEREKLIIGYAFDHYFSNPNEPDELRIRFQYSNENNRENVENQLELEVKKLLPDYANKERIWDSPEHILQAYEFGSRCAFLAWELIENKRFPEEYFSQFLLGENEKGTLLKRIPLEFQIHFSHGVMNSLGIPKIPNERLVHYDNMLESTGSKNKQELIKWLQEHLKEQ